ncbi:hypothetical protein PF005_g4110 [Phytophthora fragariae]|uniref:Secreted protein n=1 Tax=Phytophthora fragariae TaxID=53985 RepID=A0A6A4A815_9STRA|nr:hypothetical protein PF003_g20761 [Phytophthora fragariae]KAE8945752.1 hypothetical protein PF009_g4611 [Phytophthora fragariae]KAE9007131.1 hypothetical protein PF011_g11264 [Phytophthora fragariae]KAE9107648.1 hypothetical protein PF010_g12199 [Phytophthora fragariae]KAE9131545.1 hypothetical protein PF007_g4098 [Phytophthora fragariae]
MGCRATICTALSATVAVVRSLPAVSVVHPFLKTGWETFGPVVHTARFAAPPPEHGSPGRVEQGRLLPVAVDGDHHANSVRGSRAANRVALVAASRPSVQGVACIRL